MSDTRTDGTEEQEIEVFDAGTTRQGGSPPVDEEQVARLTDVLREVMDFHDRSRVYVESIAYYLWSHGVRWNIGACFQGGSPAGEPTAEQAVLAAWKVACGNVEPLPPLPTPDSVYWRQCEAIVNLLRAAASGSARPPEPTGSAGGRWMAEAGAHGYTARTVSAPLVCLYGFAAREYAEDAVLKLNALRGSARPGAADPTARLTDDDLFALVREMITRVRNGGDLRESLRGALSRGAADPSGSAGAATVPEEGR